MLNIQVFWDRKASKNTSEIFPSKTRKHESYQKKIIYKNLVAPCAIPQEGPKELLEALVDYPEKKKEDNKIESVVNTSDSSGPVIQRTEEKMRLRAEALLRQSSSISRT